MSINRVFISGNLTRDAELRQTSGGMQVLRFGVAVNDRAKNQQTGQWEDRPNFVDCVAFGARAEGLARVLRKGMRVAVDGQLRYSSWQAQDGSRRSKLEVVANGVELPPRQGDGQGEPAAAASPRPSAPSAGGDLYDADIPF